MAEDYILVAVLCPNRQAWENWVWNEIKPGDSYRQHQDRLHTEDVIFHAVFPDQPFRVRGYRFDSYMYSDEYWQAEDDCARHWINACGGEKVLWCLRASMR